jgi:hypothetical protein
MVLIHVVLHDREIKVKISASKDADKVKDLKQLSGTKLPLAADLKRKSER